MNGDSPPVFIADANLFIEAHRRYYGLDICPGFWECLVHYSGQHRLLSIDRVRTELVSYGDEMSDWVKDAPDDLFVSSLDEAVTEEYRDIMRWVYGNSQIFDFAEIYDFDWDTAVTRRSDRNDEERSGPFHSLVIPAQAGIHALVIPASRHSRAGGNLYSLATGKLP